MVAAPAPSMLPAVLLDLTSTLVAATLHSYQVCVLGGKKGLAWMRMERGRGSGTPHKEGALKGGCVGLHHVYFLERIHP